MRNAYRIIGHLIAACVVLQAAWIAFGSFQTWHKLDEGAVLDKGYQGGFPEIMHGVFGLGVIPLLAIALLVLSFFVGIPGGVRAAGFVLLAVVVQIGLVFLAFPVPVVGALHGMNAFAVLGTAELAARRASNSKPAVDAQPVAV